MHSEMFVSVLNFVLLQAERTAYTQGPCRIGGEAEGP